MYIIYTVIILAFVYPCVQVSPSRTFQVYVLLPSHLDVVFWFGKRGASTLVNVIAQKGLSKSYLPRKLPSNPLRHFSIFALETDSLQFGLAKKTLSRSSSFHWWRPVLYVVAEIHVCCSLKGKPMCFIVIMVLTPRHQFPATMGLEYVGFVADVWAALPNHHNGPQGIECVFFSRKSSQIQTRDNKGEL